MHYHFYLNKSEKVNRVAQAENVALSPVERPFLLVRPVVNECVFGRLLTLLKVLVGFAEL